MAAMSPGLRGMASRPPRLSHSADCAIHVPKVLTQVYPYSGGGVGGAGGHTTQIPHVASQMPSAKLTR